MLLRKSWRRDDLTGLLRKAEARLSDRNTRRCLLRIMSYLLAMLGLNLAWEIAQIPLYTIWTNAPIDVSARAVVHCTFGDALIAGLAVFVAWMVADRPRLQAGMPLNVGALAICLGLAFTLFSEWRATQVSHSWEYSSWMPVIPVLQVGLTPVLQWLVLPPIAMQLVFGLGNRLSPGRI